LGFTVHRPPCGEVSLCWYRPSGGDITCCVHVGVARPGFAGNAREDRLALAVFGCDVPARRASLRRIRSRDPFDASRSLVIKAGNQSTPPLTTNRPVEAPLLRDPNTRIFKRASCRAGHRPHVEVLHSNRVEPARQIGCRLLDPVASPVGFAGFESRDRQPGARSAVEATFGARQALLQATQPHLLTGFQVRGVQQLAGGQCRRYGHTAIDADHAGIPWSWDRVGDVGEGDMPAPGPISSDAIGLHIRAHGARRSVSDPPDLGHPDPPVTPADLFDMAWLEPDLSEAFMYAGLAPRGAAMGAGEEVPHGLREVPQCLLLHGLRPGRQPVVFGTGLGQLGRLLVVRRGAAAWLPKLLLLHGQVPHKPRMPAMLQQHHLLNRRRQQPEPRHARKVTAHTDINSRHTPAHVAIGRCLPPRRKCQKLRRRSADD
jgi:hypothetical protein